MFKKPSVNPLVLLIAMIVGFLRNDLVAQQEINLKHTAISQFNLPDNQSGPESFGGFIHFVFKYDCWTTVLNLHSRLDAGFATNGSKYRYQGKTYDLNVISQYDQRGLDGLRDIKIKSVSYIFKFTNIQYTNSTKASSTHTATAQSDVPVKSYIGIEFDCDKYTNPKVYEHVSSLGLTIVGISSARFENTEIIEERIKNYIKMMENKESYDKVIKLADENFNKKDYNKAKQYYESALKILPNENYPSQQLKKIEDLISKAEETAKKEKITKLLDEGDKALADNQPTMAKEKYEEVLKLDPSNGLAKTGIQKTENAISNAKKTEEGKTNSNETGNETNPKDAETKKKDEEVQKKQQELEEKEKAEETARQKAIEEEKARQQAEKERLERQNQYYQEKQQQRDANTDLAVGSAVELLLLHIKLGQIIYGNLDTDRYGSLFSNDNWRFTMQTGYSITTMPMIFNSFFEDYDGNDYSYTTESVDMQSGTLDLNGGMELWPMYGKQFGFGFHGQGGAGHGFLLQQFTWFGQGGAKAYLGFEKMKLYGEYTIGFRTISKVAWIDPQELGSGKLKYNFHRIFTGLRFSIPAEVESKGTNITVGPLFELQDFRNMNYFNPILVRWNNGFKAEIDIENRLNIFAEFFMNYRRSGEIEETYEQKFKATGTYFRVGVLRNFDFFGESPYAHADPNINRIKEKSAFTGISFLNPSFNWLTDKNKMNSMKKVQLGVNVAFEQDIRLFSNINFMTGAIFAINGGGTSYNGAEEVSFKSHSIAVPLGLRLYLENIRRPYKRWISGAIKNDFSLFNSTDGFTDVSSKRYTRSLSFGGGVDYMLGANTLARIGLNLDYGTSSIFSEKTVDLRKRSISLQAGFIF